jgi:hypothetical protein
MSMNLCRELEMEDPAASLKLEITLRYLATGDSFSSLAYLFRVPKCTISKFIPVACAAIYEALGDFLKVNFIKT